MIPEQTPGRVGHAIKADIASAAYRHTRPGVGQNKGYECRGRIHAQTADRKAPGQTTKDKIGTRDDRWSS